MRTILLDATSTAGGGTATIDEPKIRADEAKKTREAVQAETGVTAEKVKTRNTEIKALADEGVKQYGERWGGEPGKVFVVGERIRALAQELCEAPSDRGAAETRLDFKTRMASLVESSRPPKEQIMAANLPSELASRCSFQRILAEAAKGDHERSTCFMPKGGAELEAHKELRKEIENYPNGSQALGQGLLLPSNMPSGMRSLGGARKTRDSLAGDFLTAGALIAPEFMGVIELLRNMPALSKAGCTFLGGVMGNLVFPRQEAPTTGQSVPEGAALTEYDQGFGQVKMTPHRVGSFQRYSRLALLQPTYDFAAIVMRDHLAVIALYIDEMGLNGSGGADQPLGLMNQPGIGTVTFAGSASSAYKNTIALETAIRKANIYDPVSFITTSVARGTLRVTPATLTGSTVVSGTSNAIWTSEGDNEQCIGRPAVDSQQVPNDRLVALVGRHVMLAQWGGLAIVLDTLSRAEFDEYRLAVNTYIDVALRHAQAVAVSADSLASLT